jgi:hypothetical protein
MTGRVITEMISNTLEVMKKKAKTRTMSEISNSA